MLAPGGIWGFAGRIALKPFPHKVRKRVLAA
jgi:hypothetical protein